MTRIRISLLPAELKKQSSMMKMWTIMALVLAVIAMIMLAGNILFSFWLNTPVADLKSLKDQNASMTENIGRLSYIQEMFDEIENNNAIIETLMGKSPDWTYVMDETTSGMTVNGIDMSRMEIIAVGETTGCLVKGKTENTKNLDRWLAHMESLDSVESVDLGNITTQPYANGRLVFHFDAWITIAEWNKE